MREAASRGYWVSPRTPYGYRRVQIRDGVKQRIRLEQDTGTSWVVESIFEKAMAGIGTKEIAKQLNADGIPSPKGKQWGKGQVYLILTNENYAGILTWGVKGRYHREAGLEPIRIPGGVPGIAEEAVFRRLQENLKARAPQITLPRRSSSQYLLSGLLRCGWCGAAMFGVAAKSGQFHYYVCATAHRKGRGVCGMKAVPRPLMETLVVNRVRDIILQEEHIRSLVQFPNEELASSLHQVEERVKALDSQIADVDRRLERLYDSLETGKLPLDDVAPRIHELRSRRGILHRAQVEAGKR